MMQRLSTLFQRTWREMPAAGGNAAEKLLLRAGYWLPLREGTALGPVGVLLYQRLAAVLSDCLLPVANSVTWPGSPAMALSSLAGQVRSMVGTVLSSYRQLPLSLTYLNWNGAHTAWQFAALLPPALGNDAAWQVGLPSLVKALSLPLRTVADLSPGAEKAVALFVLQAEGSDRWLGCSRCRYEATETAAVALSPPPSEGLGQPLHKVATPGCHTITALADFLGIPERRTAKAIFLAGDGDLFLVVVRGDTRLNKAKLQAVTGVSAFRPATEDEIRQGGAVPGSASPIGLREGYFRVIVDRLVAASSNLVAGANEEGVHLLNSNYGRDYQAEAVADLTQATAGDSCPACGKGVLQERRGYRVGEWGRFPGLDYRDGNGSPAQAVLWAGWVDLAALSVALAAVHHDENGLSWPPAVAPYDVHLLSLAAKDQLIAAEAERLAETLAAAGFALLYDDRPARAGVKFNDADLLGLPWQVVVGRKFVREGVVEVRRRGGARVEMPPSELMVYLRQYAGGEKE